MESLFVAIGIDPGLRETGYAVLGQDGPLSRGLPRVLEAGIVKTNDKSRIEERLEEIYLGLSRLFDEYAPRGVAIEALYSDYKHPRTALLMGHARGAVLLACAQSGCHIKEYPPSKVKKALTGNGSAKKMQVQKCIQRLLELSELPTPDHVSDAIALALCYISEEARVGPCIASPDPVDSHTSVVSPR